MSRRRIFPKNGKIGRTPRGGTPGFFRFTKNALPCLLLSACATLPATSHRPYSFPNGAFFLPPKERAYEVIGTVKSKVNFNALDQDHSEDTLCTNYFNKAVGQLVKIAQDKGADAVVDVHSVVLLMDGRLETYPRAECSDDGEEGQILAEAIAVKWKKPLNAKAKVP